VLAANNEALVGPRPTDFRYFGYSAITQRAILLEGFMYTPNGRREYLNGKLGKDLYLDRRALIVRIFAQGDAVAAREAKRQYGVRYLLVDKRDGFPSTVPPVADLVFSDRDLDVYALRRDRA
jgi:hypothetical protein